MAFGRKSSADVTAVQNAARTLLANIRFAGVDKPIKSIVVTSSIPNEGKSTMTCNLARVIAASGKRVLVVECDMRNRTMSGLLGASARHGIYAVLSGEVELDRAVVPTGQKNLYFLDAEPHIPNPSDILSSMRFRSLMSAMETVYDYILLDTPPVGAFVDAAIIAELADATLLVVRERFVKREEVVAAYDQLMKADAHIAGVVMNMCEAETNEYYSRYSKYGASADVIEEPSKAMPVNTKKMEERPHTKVPEVHAQAKPQAASVREPLQAAATSPNSTTQFMALASKQAKAAPERARVDRRAVRSAASYVASGSKS